MIENKSDVLIAILIVVTIAAGAFLFSQTYEKDAIGIFPKKLGDMSIVSFNGGGAAIEAIKGLHDGLPRRIENAYVVDYEGNYSKAKFWVTESESNYDAVVLVNAMNKIVNTSGVYSNSTPIIIGDINVYFVSGSSGHGLYHYFYAKDNRIFWVEIDNSDESYRMNFLKESIRMI
jgi:CTP:phosphocholine cytidylyltransferase-like protein